MFYYGSKSKKFRWHSDVSSGYMYSERSLISNQTEINYAHSGVEDSSSSQVTR